MKFDAVLSYHSKKVDEAQRFYDVLRNSGFRVFFDGQPEAGGAAQDFRAVLRSGAAILVMVTDDGAAPWDEPGNAVYQAIRLTRDRLLIPVLLHDDKPKFFSDDIPIQLRNQSFLAFEASFSKPDSLKRLMSAIPRRSEGNGAVDQCFLEAVKESFVEPTIAHYQRDFQKFIDTHEEEVPQAEMAQVFSFVSHLKRRRYPSDRLRVLDVGSGPGHHTRFLAKCGFNAVGIDFCQRLVEHATSAPPGSSCTFIHGDMRSLHLHLDPDHLFDGVWANASCLHLPRKSMESQLDQFRKILSPNGILGLSLQLGMSTLQAEGRFFERYEADEVREMLRNHGFEIVDEIGGDSTKSSTGRDRIKRWFSVIASVKAA